MTDGLIVPKEFQCEACEDAKYVRQGGKYVPCVCLKRDKLRERLGSFSQVTRVPKSCTLQPYLGKDILLYGDWEKIRANIAKALIDDENARCFPVPAQALTNFQFDNSDGGNAKLALLRQPAWILLVLGVSDVPNCYLPELVISLLADRKMMGKTSWVYFAKSPKDLFEKYVGSSGTNLRTWLESHMDEVVNF